MIGVYETAFFEVGVGTHGCSGAGVTEDGRETLVIEGIARSEDGFAEDVGVSGGEGGGGERRCIDGGQSRTFRKRIDGDVSGIRLEVYGS